MKPVAFYRRNLPHLVIPGYPFFITTRLVESMPLEKLKILHKELEQELSVIQAVKNSKKKIRLRKEINRSFFINYDRLLHEQLTGPDWLDDERVAKIVRDSLHWGDGKRYHLIAFTIMPNHIHVVLLPIWVNKQEREDQEPVDEDAYFLARILESIKKYTAREANKILGRKGQFWQHESYDHLLRNQKELERAVHYTLKNPVKAGLVKKPKYYRWSYVNWEYV